jgi:hypothetical protein
MDPRCPQESTYGNTLGAITTPQVQIGVPKATIVISAPFCNAWLIFGQP